MGNLISALGLTSVAPVAIPTGTAAYLSVVAASGRHYGPVMTVPTGTATIQVSASETDGIAFAAGLETGVSLGLAHDPAAYRSYDGPGSFAVSGFGRPPQTARAFADLFVGSTVSLYLLFLSANGTVLPGAAL
jgi:hypothetical protein